MEEANWSVEKAKRAGCLSMKLVVAPPDRNSGWRSTFSKKRMLVFTPRMWNS